MTGHRLFLLRHAKSSWADPFLEDIDRPLNKRGRRASTAMARYIEAEGILPQLVLCSPSVRTRMTLEALLPLWQGAAPVQYDDRLYEASGAGLLSVFQEAAASHGIIMLIGHNPGLQDLALTLVKPSRNAESDAIEDKFPTGALAELTAGAADWRAARRGSFRLRRFIRPRDVEQDQG